jgi:tetratricopeptide (TPR) repeat protein
VPVNAKAQETRPVLRIFISSTAVDLIDYREKVRDAVLRLEGLPIAMETFSASGQPASECMRMAAEADAVVCIVAHRYGYVPPPELGGDGKRSITWLEVDAARQAGKPVFAFLVDPQAPWTEVREQDRLTSEPPENALEIAQTVQYLKNFKEYIERRYSRRTFKNKDELAGLVTAAIANLVLQSHNLSISASRVWKPLFCHALQPAQHFRGRDAARQEIREWVQTSVTPDRVVSVVAAGGTGKTALVQQALSEAMQEGPHRNSAGLFVWSFYEDPYTEAFLREAYHYFTGEAGAPAGGMLERLQLALSGDNPHVLVLDGLELVQSEGDHQRGELRGKLNDPQLKRLLRALAGGVGSARALVTSRFPLVDLQAYSGAGHRALLLDDLEQAIAFSVLRAWKVNGDDFALERLLEPLNVNGYYHALSVAVLGSYLGNFAGGDPQRAPEFSLEDAQEFDPKARKLGRILEQYARVLAPAERDLLARLSLFPRGVKVEILASIVQAGGEAAGALIGLVERELAKYLERLKELGLVFRNLSDQRAVYSAHPFVREFFRNLLSASAESVHESVRARLAPSLEARPKTKPKDPLILDQYELLIEQTLLAGRMREAFDLYLDGLGGYKNLGWALGEHVRGVRILERFIPGDDFSRIKHHLPAAYQNQLINSLGLFAQDLGDLDRARAAFIHCRRLNTNLLAHKTWAIVTQNLAWVEFDAGRFPQSLTYSQRAVLLATEASFEGRSKYSHAYRAMAHFALGNIKASSVDFQSATEIIGESLYSFWGALEAECKLTRGDYAGALCQAEANRDYAHRNNINNDLFLLNALLARLFLRMGSPVEADEYLRAARVFATRSGDIELQLRCFQAACELESHVGDFPQAIAEAESGIFLADTCGFGKYSIDLRIALAEALLAAQSSTDDALKALQKARHALSRSEENDCQYAWGKADGLHFCGVAHLRLGERELARQRLTAALELRQRLGHGRIEETRKALALCGK